MRFLSEEEIIGKIKDAHQQQLFDDIDTVVHFVDLETIRDRLEEVKRSFPSNTIHTVAVKANPLAGVLKAITNEGFHLEGASFEETIHGLNCGASRVCWDSPVKTEIELAQISAHKNVIINCDSLEEASLVQPFINGHDVLLRINPQQVGTAHSSMSVAGHYSKFGEPISNRSDIIAFISQNDFISGLHVHTSSQTLNFSELVTSIKHVVQLAVEINKLRTVPLKYINIGGGFPVSYEGKSNFQIKNYVDELLAQCPELFTQFMMITEFGRYYHANAGFTLLKIARVKQFENRQVIIGHAGADMFLRECYQPGVWPHRMILLNNKFTIKQNAILPTDLAGPLCFGGDYVEREFDFSNAQAGDHIVIQDSGANSVALWSKHCSRNFPKCVLIEKDQFLIIRERDTLERNLGFWS